MSSKGFDIYIEEALKYGKYYKNPIALGRIIKKIVSKHINNAKVYLFGSVVRKSFTAFSDIDVLIVTPKELSNDEMSELKATILIQIDAPVEIHVVSEDGYRNWYRRFIHENEIIEV